MALYDKLLMMLKTLLLYTKMVFRLEQVQVWVNRRSKRCGCNYRWLEKSLATELLDGTLDEVVLFG